MPMYDFQCINCGHEEQDKILSYEEALKSKCPKCEHQMAILMQPVAAHWKCDCPTSSKGRGIK